ncbi:MAG TPA: sodium:proton exchanger [Dehalococcoidia bacterium]|nr:sodium:proton exchanger [Dehalococcoidia bacterium]
MENLSPFVGIAILLAAALVGGMIAHRLRQPVILGYLVVGMAVGPHSLGLVTDLELVEAAATIGVALLMFTLGLEISVSQLRQVGRVGIWGGIAQILLTFGAGLVAGYFLFDWALPQSILFGLIISLSSTAVCLKLLMERGELSSVHGRIMLAILILQDISVVVMALIVPLMGGEVDNLFLSLVTSTGKALLFIAIAIVSGLWILPWLMGRIGRVRTRELFLLIVLVLCFGAVLGTQVFGLPIVFGTFLIGLVLRETRFAHQALGEITPLRDIFATLFFVSLGMLLDPSFVLDNWVLIALTVIAIILIKLLIISGIVLSFGYSSRIALLAGAGLFQIGEFGFILAQTGIDAGLVTEQFYSVILASAIITMLLTPLSINLVSWLYPRVTSTPAIRRRLGKGLVVTESGEPAKETRRVVVAGYGRIGQNVSQGLLDAGVPHIVIDIDPERIAEARDCCTPRIYGDASNPNVLNQTDLGRVKTLVITFPDPMAVIATVKAAMEINPDLKIIARVHRAGEAKTLKKIGITELISPEYEASLEFIRRTLTATGMKKTDIKQALPVIEQDQKVVEFSTEEE